MKNFVKIWSFSAVMFLVSTGSVQAHRFSSHLECFSGLGAFAHKGNVFLHQSKQDRFVALHGERDGIKGMYFMTEQQIYWQPLTAPSGLIRLGDLQPWRDDPAPKPAMIPTDVKGFSYSWKLSFLGNEPRDRAIGAYEAPVFRFERDVDEKSPDLKRRAWVEKKMGMSIFARDRMQEIRPQAVSDAAARKSVEDEILRVLETVKVEGKEVSAAAGACASGMKDVNREIHTRAGKIQALPQRFKPGSGGEKGRMPASDTIGDTERAE